VSVCIRTSAARAGPLVLAPRASTRVLSSPSTPPGCCRAPTLSIQPPLSIFVSWLEMLLVMVTPVLISRFFWRRRDANAQLDDKAATAMPRTKTQDGLELDALPLVKQEPPDPCVRASAAPRA
jgi:hypothetical protein